VASGWFPFALLPRRLRHGAAWRAVTTQTLVQADDTCAARVLSSTASFRGGSRALIGILSDVIGLQLAIGIGAAAGMVAWVWRLATADHDGR
jgi:hypothetical protein